MRYLGVIGRDSTVNTNYKPGYIYVVRFGPLYKIGLSLTPHKRFKQINPQKVTQHIPGGYAIPTAVTIVLVKYVPDMKSTEAFLHQQFRSKIAVPGFVEWFYLEQFDVDWIDVQINFACPDPNFATPMEEKISKIIGNGTPLILCRTGRPRIHFLRQDSRTFCGLGTKHGWRHAEHLTSDPVCPKCTDTAFRSLNA